MEGAYSGLLPDPCGRDRGRFRPQGQRRARQLGTTKGRASLGLLGPLHFPSESKIPARAVVKRTKKQQWNKSVTACVKVDQLVR